MNVKKGVIGLLTALALSWVPAVYAADNGTEFGVEDDLTVLGTGGDQADPDVEIKGFSVFGATQSAPALQIPMAPGNVFVNGYVQISSGLYVAAPSTFTSTVNLPAPASIYVTGGTGGQVLSKNASTGSLQWSDVSSMVSGDNLGNHIATTTLQMNNNAIVNVASITVNSYITAYSSMTVGGAAGVGGDLSVKGNVNLGDAAGDAITAAGAVTAQNGVSVTGGDLSATNNLTVNGNAQLGNAVTDTHAINRAVEAGVALSVDSVGTAGNYAAKFYSGGSLAAWIKKK